ncbi:metal-dependent hydrolase [Sulfuricella sp. T08]|uniref:hypothetical protein n=1 Tax=Sulfuricella sp. T08 TaxID=1632857 RepID=UPI0006179FBE|nr:hypothetical protein [Sulfuricella sp. T08]GAO37016.1 metal-dependent hydrolase [Sulfuricella sp. T08]
MAAQDTDSSSHHVQEAWDWLSVSCDAATRAESRFRNLFNKIAQRGIDEARRENPAQPSLVDLRDIHFQPTEEEKQQLRDAYLEWQAFKIIWAEKEEAYSFVKDTGRPFSASEKASRGVDEAKLKLLQFFVKPAFYILVTIAALIVIAHATI